MHVKSVRIKQTFYEFDSSLSALCAHIGKLIIYLTRSHSLQQHVFDLIMIVNLYPCIVH